MIGVGLLGCGTVGSGVVELLEKNSDMIASRTGDKIVLKKVLDKDLEKCRKLGIPEEKLTQDYTDILKDKDIQIVIELIGGIEPAFSMIRQAMQAGKHVVTANKDLIAEKGKELFDMAGKVKNRLLFRSQCSRRDSNYLSLETISGR